MTDHTLQPAYLGRLASQITYERLGPYLAAERQDLSRALARYYWNTELCQCYYPALQALEVALRNNIDRTLRSEYPVGTEGRAYQDIRSWIDRSPRVAIHRGAEAQITKGKEAILKRTPAGPTLANAKHDDLVAAMSFGFWTGFLAEEYVGPNTTGIVLWGRPAPLEPKVFPGAAGQSMTSIRGRFNAIRHLRNRVFHHEPVWPKNESQASPQAQYDHILEALRWLGGEQARVPARLHPSPLALLDAAKALPVMRDRLLATVDDILAEAQAKNAEKIARKAARKKEAPAAPPDASG